MSEVYRQRQMSYYMTWGYLGYRKQIPWYLFFRRWVANKLVKAIAAVKGRSNKSLKGKWHTLWRGKTVYILSDITTMFKRVFVLFLAKSYCWLRLRRKAHRADQCPLMPLREFKSWKLNYGHWGQSRAKGQVAPVHLSAGSTSQWIACLAC